MRNERSFPAFEVGGTTTTDRRAELKRQELVRAEERQRRLAEQTSPQHTAEQRIRIWEELHGLGLPQSTTHKLLRLIASHTALTLEQVRAEQQRRRAASVT